MKPKSMGWLGLTLIAVNGYSAGDQFAKGETLMAWLNLGLALAIIIIEWLLILTDEFKRWKQQAAKDRLDHEAQRKGGKK